MSTMKQELQLVLDRCTSTQVRLVDTKKHMLEVGCLNENSYAVKCIDEVITSNASTIAHLQILIEKQHD